LAIAFQPQTLEGQFDRTQDTVYPEKEYGSVVQELTATAVIQLCATLTRRFFFVVPTPTSHSM